MARYDLLIRNGTLVLPDGPQQGDLAVVAGQCVAVGSTFGGSATTELDATGLHVFPGVIDAHMHCNEPGRTEWEGFATATAALAVGGATSFIDMPLNAHPPTLDASSFAEKQRAASQNCLIDYALWGGLTPENLDTMDELAAAGVIGYKAFMANSGISDFTAADDATLLAGMQIAARHALPVAVHAEDDALTAALAAQALAAGRTDVRAFLASRPVRAELLAIERAIALAEQSGCALHVVHVSSGAGVRLVAEARARGVDVSCETCPHYLTLTEDDVERIGALATCAPPLRPAAEQAALWELLAAGTLPMVASDHSPAPAAMKTGDDFFRIWGGISGCQHTLALLLEGYHDGRIGLHRLADALAGFVARRFRLPRKGALAPGYDADLALVDLRGTTAITTDTLLYRHRHSPYTGTRLRSRVVRTILRGQTVAQDGRPSGRAGGRLIVPDAA